MSDQELTTMVRAVVTRTERAAPGPGLLAEVATLKSAGIAKDMHVGRHDLNPRETVEWYAGQFISIVEDQAWFAMNSLINCLNKFVPEPPKETP